MKLKMYNTEAYNKMKHLQYTGIQHRSNVRNCTGQRLYNKQHLCTKTYLGSATNVTFTHYVSYYRLGNQRPHPTKTFPGTLTRFSNTISSRVECSHYSQ